MLDNIKISAVVVTYNRLELLKECIVALKNQSRSIDEIIVVNNSSTDGTLDWLNEQDDLTVITQENSGSSGGQYTGIKTAYENGHDWIFTMDDDAEPDTNYVEKILLVSRGRYVLGGKVVNLDGEILLNHRGYFKRNKIYGEQIHFPTLLKEYSQNIIKIDFFSFVGPVYHRDVIKKIGLPNKKMFIYHDDVEFSLRISAFFEMYLITDAVIIHKEQYINYVHPWEKFIQRKKYSIKINKIYFEYFSNRNMVFTLKHHFAKKNFILSTTKFLFIKIRRIIIYETYKWKLLKGLFKSLNHGCNGKFE